MNGTYILVGDSQAVGLEDEARGWRQVGAQARVGIVYPVRRERGSIPS